MIKIEHLTHTYQSEQGKNIALNDLSLEINEGEHLAVLGQNGCGKSTLAKHLNALLLPDKGTVTIDGMDSTDENSLWQIRQKSAWFSKTLIINWSPPPSRRTAPSVPKI